MVKIRSAYYCNLKLFLIYLVVYGHWIENKIASSGIIEMQYRLIYLIHMPLFAFISGLFLRKQEDCLRQLKRLLPLYFILQIVFVTFNNEELTIWEPFWHLWYLFSFCLWAIFGYLYFCYGNGRGKMIIFILSIFIALMAGYVPWIDRTYSLSRALVFFPYFWLGLIAHSNIQWHKYRRWGMLSLIVAGILMLLWGHQIPTNFLYHAAPYGKLENGLALRFLCYILSMMFGFFCLTIMPAKKFPFSKAGADTMPAYLIHAQVIIWIREFCVPWSVCALGSALLLYLIYKIFQWNSPLYDIVCVKPLPQKTAVLESTDFPKKQIVVKNFPMT